MVLYCTGKRGTVEYMRICALAYFWAEIVRRPQPRQLVRREFTVDSSICERDAVLLIGVFMPRT